ncbi:hypothetical protein BAE44_0023312 [Dichanthelium oligosanthes]|uniref:Uncharacterized protein n=1 Tax=Dichanthelium oligosanthes TaxID=888268 RepID=A0A1E5US00_9POAL|nr:hypothetical protein BAE44_0023312 [Dichanthelium oligosanthes]
MEIGASPCFDGMGFSPWKVLMQEHLQAKGLDVWRVTKKDKKNDDAESMYSRLNVLVNEINALDLKKIEDGELNQQILHSLRRPDNDVVQSILLDKELNKITPNQVLNKVMAHELCFGIKPNAPSSLNNKSIVLSSKQEKIWKKAIQERSSDEEQGFSSDKEMDPKLIKQVEKLRECLKNINMMGYMVYLMDGHHNASDDEFDEDSSSHVEELLELIYEQRSVLKKQSKEIK